MIPARASILVSAGGANACPSRHAGTRFDVASGMTHTALVVDPNPDALARTVRLLGAAGYAVSSAATFAPARCQLAILRPDVLVTAVRLDGFNGLHLVTRGRALLADLVAIVTHVAPDRLLQAEASAHGALFLSWPIDRALLVEVIATSLAARGPRAHPRVARRWPRRRLTSRVEIALGPAPGIVVDVSYGGAQLQLREPPGDPTCGRLDQLAGAGPAPVPARRVWTRSAGPNGPWWLGLELNGRSAAGTPWQAFVDASR
jgi:CheY-like chemotaxis protein